MKNKILQVIKIHCLLGGLMLLAYSNNFAQSVPKIGVIDPVGNHSNTNTIAGKVYVDANKDCTVQNQERRLKSCTLLLINQASGKTFRSETDAQGHYSFKVGKGDFSIYLEMPSPYYRLACQDQIDISFETNHESAHLDFGVETFASCAFLDVKINTSVLHSNKTSTYTVSFQNKGTATAQDAFVEVLLDNYLQVQSTSLPIQDIEEGLYTFELGDIEAGQSGQFEIEVLLDEEAIQGQTHCTSVRIFPDNICDPTVTNINVTAVGLQSQTAHNFGSTGRGSGVIFEDNVILGNPVDADNGGMDNVVDDPRLEDNDNDEEQPTEVNSNTSSVSSILNKLGNDFQNQGLVNDGVWTGEELNLFYSNLEANFPKSDRFSDEQCQENTPYAQTIDFNNNNSSNSNQGNSNTPSTTNTDKNTSNTSSSNSSGNSDNTTSSSDDESSIDKIFEYEKGGVIELQAQFSPNPFGMQTTLTLRGMQQTEQLSLRIFNVAGQQMRQLTLTSDRMTIERGSLTEGLYFYQINDQTGKLLSAGKLMVR